jgi:hypothetical protein
MKKQALMRATAWGLLALGVALGPRAPAGEPKATTPKPSPQMQVGSYRLSGPYTQGNLTIFLVHGPDTLKGKTFLTLQEALAQKKAIVHETQNVNQLAVENVSADVEVFIQSGDIVKGGQQDRTIAYDLIVPPKSGKVPVTAFCVEQGRWSKRGGESEARFEEKKANLPSKDAKLDVKGAAKGGDISKVQKKVWMEVARKQMMLSRALGRSVRSGKSESSLQLTLEDKKLLEAVDTYTKKLSPLLDGHKDVIGYAFAINGQINSADIYASHALFQKLWPQLLAATVVEAIAEQQKGKKFAPVKAEAIKAFMQDADKGKASNTDVSKRVRMVTQETKENVLFATQDRENKGLIVHKNYIKK